MAHVAGELVKVKLARVCTVLVSVGLGGAGTSGHWLRKQVSPPILEMAFKVQI